MLVICQTTNQFPSPIEGIRMFVGIHKFVGIRMTVGIHKFVGIRMTVGIGMICIRIRETDHLWLTL